MKDTDILNDFIEKFWFVPSDALIRSAETVIWNTQDLTPPILDIGCGDGRNSTLVFKKQGKIDVGIDSDPKVIESARKCGVYTKVICVRAEKMPFRSNTFNTIVANSTFEHIKGDDIKAISEVSRVLNKGGRFMFTVPTPRFLICLNKLGIKGKYLKWYNKRVEHFHYRSLKEWEDILKMKGLEIKEYTYYFPQKLVNIWWRLFRIVVFKPYKRELWSYLKDSPYGKLIPQRLVVFVLKKILSKYFRQSISEEGSWLFILAEKK